MSLTSALSIAQSALRNTSQQTSIVSRNISEASNPDYARRQALLASSAPGARVVIIQRAANEQLLRQHLSAVSASSAQNSLLAGFETLQSTLNGVENGSSASALIGKLQQALQTYATTPSNPVLAETAVDAARQLAQALNEGSENLQNFRVEADSQISLAVDELNSLLAQFHEANKQVVSDTRAGRDASDALDRRDALLKKISEYVPVSTINRDDNDMVVMTGDGTMLYETTPRQITFEPQAGYSATSTGNAVYVDGIPLPGGTGGATTASGKIGGLLQLRDSVAPAMQRQLDEIARALITVFAETDPLGVQPDAAGLFTASGLTGIPADGVLVDGLAGRIAVNAAFLANPALLRDGGANGPAYKWNTSNGASYGDLLQSYIQKLDAPMNFDPAAGIGDRTTLGGYASNAVSWLEAARKDASVAAETKNATIARTEEALSNETGVNIDYEMTLLLDLEHSYQASARLLQAVDEMLAALLNAVR